MNEISNLFQELWQSRRLILELAKNDFKVRYAGSFFGIFWAFVQPIITILVFWFVFEVGLRTAKIQEIPFILWFSSGLIPWFFFADAWASATNSFIEYSYLVKKIVFRISSLPIIKILSSLFIHVFLVLFLLILFIFYGYFPNMIISQLLYYVFCIVVLVLSLSFFTASIIPFFKDTAQLISIILQFGMWMTPIMWKYTMLPEKFHWLFYLNPMFYVVEGFRNTLIGKTWFWENGIGAACFWGLTIIFFVVGTWTFKKMKPHFSDVL
ncbi:ABC transporter permease [Acetonema longum]|uniref:Transport permease protein n=1 Tax=Acetonema longum DSM 6540 TaxID=1009370 RepID=F7NNQ7_9FIRM|nr:ABC transporter permease [Acetonema longum]EGO62241.1 ABC-2 type transporter [Acetonema longum DSM 6540]